MNKDNKNNDEDTGSKKSKPYAVASVSVLTNQINKRWPDRQKNDDNISSNSKVHSSLINDYNPDSKGATHALDIDKNFSGSQYDVNWFSDQLIAYARNKKPGSQRIKNVAFEDNIASGTYPSHYWTWRNGDYGYFDYIHISFTTAGESDSMQFDIPILVNGEAGMWDGSVPFFDILMNAMRSGASNTATWRLACRLKELGFLEGPVLPDGKQAFPTKAIKNMQDYMGWNRDPYNENIHKTIWKQLKISTTDI